MSILVPSQVVEYLKTRYPNADSPNFYLDIDYAPIIAYLLSLIESIPAHLLTLQGVASAEFGEAVSALKIALGRWNAGEHYVSKGIPGSRQVHPLVLLRKHLSSLHDEGAEPTTNALSFILDIVFRDSLRRDLGSIDRCIQNGEWKAATVLGGSVIEALLLYGLREYEKRNNSKFQNTIQSLQQSSGIFQGTPPSNLDQWGLHQLTEVSLAVSLIQKETADQCRIAKAFRNLIHPGRAARLAQECDRGTALSTLAAVEHAIRDLTP